MDLIKENSFTFKKTISGRIYNRIYNRIYADDLVLLANNQARAESLLHCLEQAARSISVYVNAEKNRVNVF